jgi:L-lactate dehydrogenase complex protein LldG
VSREAVLQSIRTALSGDTALSRNTALSQAAPAPPSYQRTGTLTQPECLHLLEERLHEYNARVFHASESDLRDRIATILLDGGKSKIVHPSGLPTAWLDPRISWTSDLNNALTYSEIESFEGVLTAATAAVAESGSIVLQHGPAEGRRALTLLPDYHLCVLFAHQVVETLPECFDGLVSTAARPTTFISGPSATADIEMTRIKGVHGPRFLDVVLVP